jgi:hypothetical protein
MSDPSDSIELTIETRRGRVTLRRLIPTMCLPGQPPAPPTTAAEAVAMARAGLSWLAAADATALTGVEQAECLCARAAAPVSAGV